MRVLAGLLLLFGTLTTSLAQDYFQQEWAESGMSSYNEESYSEEEHSEEEYPDEYEEKYGDEQPEQDLSDCQTLVVDPDTNQQVCLD